MAGMNEGKDGRKVAKTRSWAFIVYPESAPENWLEMLAALHMQALVSPLHDRDIASDGNLKKPHWHILLIADGPISQKRANEIIQPFCGSQNAEYVISTRGYARYLSHLDDPDKAAYDPSEIKCFGGADILKLIQAEKDQIGVLSEIMEWCEDQGVSSFAVVLRFARNVRRDWMPPLVKYAFFFSRYLSSLRCEMNDRR